MFFSNNTTIIAELLSRDDKDKDRDPFAGSDRGTKRRKSNKEAETSKDSRSKENKSSSTCKDASKSQHKSFGKSAHAEEPIHTVEDSGMQQDQEFVTGDNDEQPADKEGPKRQHLYGFAANMSSLKDVYSRKRIIVVTRLLIIKKYDHGHLEETKQKLTNLTIDERYALNVALRIDGTLNDVRSTLHDIAKGIRIEYLPKRKWSGLDKRSARVMIQDIDKKLYERRLVRNLEKFVGGREYENDVRLLERTI
uniref:Uncharacterized protein n=1 Tax=Tanacetum cinerariifolium TaxID=118510 RepID=A0A6L2MBN6_TANCI|nr:hypothetical protein [Tanacetum cinerariifolium]